jgi:hypothetical protein
VADDLTIDGVFARASVDLWSVWAFTDSAPDEGPIVNATARAVATNIVVFTPQMDRTLPITLTAVGDFYFFHSHSSVSLFDHTVQTLLWNYGWLDAEGLGPWTQTNPDPRYSWTASIAPLTTLRAGHVYTLSLSLASHASIPAGADVRLDVSGFRPVPEPSTPLLTIAGTSLAVWSRRRRRHRVAITRS